LWLSGSSHMPSSKPHFAALKQRHQGQKRFPTTRSNFVIREAAMAFLEADVDGDSQLSLEEFRSLIPHSINLTEEAVHAMFRGIDRNGDNMCSMDEFFTWVLANQSEMVAEGFHQVFRQYDASGDGTLSVEEFAHAVEDLGYASEMAHTLFIEMDADGSGCLSYTDIVDRLRACSTVINQDTRKMITSLAFGHSKERRARNQRNASGTAVHDGEHAPQAGLDTTGWSLKCTDVTSLRAELMTLLRQQSASTTDLYHAMTSHQIARGEPGGIITKDQFCQALQSMGCACSIDDLQAMFAAVDGDTSGFVGITEFFRWMKHGVRASDSLPARAKMTLQHQRNKKKIPLDEIEWTPAKLCDELQDMLLRQGLTPLDLIRARADAIGASFTKKSFLKLIKTVVNDNELWSEALRFTAIESFEQMASSEGKLELSKFQQWLGRGWVTCKHELNDRTYQDMCAAAKARAASSTGRVSSVQDGVLHAINGGDVKAPIDVGARGAKSMTKQPRKAQLAVNDSTERSSSMNQNMAPSTTPIVASEPSRTQLGVLSSEPPPKVTSAKGREAVDRQFHLSQAVLQESQLRLAKALVGAADIIGYEALTLAQQGEVQAARQQFGESLEENLPPTRERKGMAVPEAASSPLATQAKTLLTAQQRRPPQQRQNFQSTMPPPDPPKSSRARMRRAELEALKEFGGGVHMPTRSSKTISNDIISLTRVLRHASAYDDWDGRGASRAQSAPARPRLARTPASSTGRLVAAPPARPSFSTEPKPWMWLYTSQEERDSIMAPHRKESVGSNVMRQSASADGRASDARQTAVRGHGWR